MCVCFGLCVRVRVCVHVFFLVFRSVVRGDGCVRVVKQIDTTIESSERVLLV